MQVCGAEAGRRWKQVRTAPRPRSCVLGLRPHRGVSGQRQGPSYIQKAAAAALPHLPDRLRPASTHIRGVVLQKDRLSVPSLH